MQILDAQGTYLASNFLRKLLEMLIQNVQCLTLMFIFLGVDLQNSLKSFNILADEELRSGIKEYS